MKTIKILIKSFLLLLLVGCLGNEWEQPEDFTDLVFTTTNGSTADQGEVNNYLSFMDLSAGATAHSWEIPDNCYFLRGPIPANLPNHDEYIINAGDTLSSDKTVHVLFKKGDSNTIIKLRNEFADSTSFIYPGLWDPTGGNSGTGGFINDTIRTVKIGDKWIAEVELLVDVYDTIRPEMEIRDINGVDIDFKSLDTITVDFGDQLILDDRSALLEDNNSRPEQTVWRVFTIEENEEDEVTIFNSSTTYDPLELVPGGAHEGRNIDTITFNRAIGAFRGRLTVRRERTETLNAANAVYEMPVIFKVNQSDGLFELSNVVEQDDDIIRIVLNDRLAEFSENVGDHFNVTVNGVDRPIASVYAHSTNTSALEMRLETPLDPTEEGLAFMSYDGASEFIVTLDERPLQSFTDVEIDVYVPTPVMQIGDIIETSGDLIAIAFDQDIDPASIAGSSNPTAGFAVTLNGVNFPIDAIAVNTEFPNVLGLDMSDTMYQDDVITVSFTGPSDIRSVGNGALTDFAAKTILPYFDQQLTDSSFEGTFGDYWVEGASGSGATVGFSTEQVNTGSQSAKLTTEKPRLESAADLSYENGATYVVSYYRYIVPGATLDAVHGDKIWLNKAVGSTAVTPRWDTATAGVWEHIVVEKEITADYFNVGIRIQPVPTSGSVFTVYYDDFEIYKKDVRP